MMYAPLRTPLRRSDTLTVLIWNNLPREDEGCGTAEAFNRGNHGTSSLFAIAGANHIHIWHHAQAANRLYRLVCGTILSNTDGVVGEIVADRQLTQCSHSDRRAEVVSKNKESRT